MSKICTSYNMVCLTKMDYMVRPTTAVFFGYLIQLNDGCVSIGREITHGSTISKHSQFHLIIPTSADMKEIDVGRSITAASLGKRKKS